MNALVAFENRKEALKLQLDAAQSVQEAIAACVMALEQTACELAQDEQDEHARQRQQAVMAVVRRAPQLLRAAAAQGELVITDAAQEEAVSKQDQVRRLIQAAGAFVLASLAVHEFIDGKTAFAVLQLAGSALLFAGGLRQQKPAVGQGCSVRAVCKVDADAMVRLLCELCQAADVCAADLMLIEQDAGMMRLSGTADDAMLDLLIVLMEAKASGRDDLAMRSLSQAEQYLHMLGVEIAQYRPENAQMFDILPTLGETRTIRPALIKDGKVLRRGAAACRMERSVQR
ncbi:MAG: hypothetical protein IJ381_09400 [Clostridia bacterium]|nr:hypothetical protein [Clostridia bacterium]